MILLSKNISFLLFGALILFMLACAYLGYSSINEGFVNGDDDEEESKPTTTSAGNATTTAANAKTTAGNATTTAANANKPSIINRPDIAPGIPNLMNNGYKIPQTNLVQSHFNGTSNVYSPYLYMKESFQPMTYDMDKYKSF
jgi:uncharacterized protein (UPF0333 family)